MMMKTMIFIIIKKSRCNTSHLSFTDICMYKSRAVNLKAEGISQAVNSSHTKSSLLLSIPGYSNDRNCELT